MTCVSVGLNPAALADVAGATEGVVLHRALAIDGDLIAFEDVSAVDFAGIELGLTATEAHGGELLDVVGDLEESLAAGEEFGTEIRPQSVANHRDIVEFRDLEELADLGGGEELGLIHQNAGDWWSAGDIRQQIKRLIGVDIHPPTVPTARGDKGSTLGIDNGLHDEYTKTALFIVEGGFDEGIAFAAVHGTVLKVKLSHMKIVPDGSGFAEGKQAYRNHKIVRDVTHMSRVRDVKEFREWDMSIGWKAMFWKSGEQPGEGVHCPECKLPKKVSHNTRMFFFQVMGIPLFPVSGKRKVYRCGYCTSTFNAEKIDLQKSIEAGTLVGAEKLADA